MFFFPTTLIFEIIAFLASVFFYLRKRDPLIFRFFLFLLVTVCVETAGWLLSWPQYVNTEAKFAMYNVFITLELAFYSYLFYGNFQKKLFRTIAAWFIPGFLLFALINMLFVQGLSKSLNTYSALLGSFFIVLFCCFYFYESIQPDQIDKQLSKQPFFWISSGLLIFYLGSVIINALFEYLRNNELQVEGRRIYTIINDFLNVILYSSFCIAFYLCPDRRKTYSSPSL